MLKISYIYLKEIVIIYFIYARKLKLIMLNLLYYFFVDKHTF